MNLDPMTLTVKSTEKSTKESTVNQTIENALRLYILNLPEIVELRNAPTPTGDGLTEDEVERIAESVGERLLEDFDFDSAVESAISYGYINLADHVDGDEVINNSGEFDALRDEVESLNSKITELEERLDNASINI